MARINLLPWRQEERQRKNKEFNLVLVAAAAVAALVIFLIFAFFNFKLDNQNQANQVLTDENARLEKVLVEIKDLEDQRTAMIEQMKVIQDLQGRRSVPVRIWDDIARAVPSSMYLVSISRVDDTITLTGFADNANVISTLVRNLDDSPWLANSAVPNIKSDAEAYKTKELRDPKDAQRPIYPEDSYISFTVTTQVKADRAPQADEAMSDGTTDMGATNTAQPAESMPAPPPIEQPVQPTDGVPAAEPVAQPTSEAPTITPTDTPADTGVAPAGGQS